MTDTNHERQITELVLLSSMYPDVFTWRTPSGSDEIHNITARSSQLAFELQINAFTLKVTLPDNYPDQAKPRAYLECEAATPTNVRRTARHYLVDVLDDLDTGEECLDVLVQSLTEKLSEIGDRGTPQAENAGECNDTKNSKSTTSVKRMLFWSHHLLATSKRKDIVSWSHELDLSGYSRPGYPGAVLVEGEADSVEEFAKRIKALRWQALQVREEEEGPVRLLVANERGKEFEEVEDIAAIVRSLRGYDQRLAEWFLVGMKIGHS